MSNPPATRFWISIYAFTALVLFIAVGVFMWLASESRREAGAGRTANARPLTHPRISEERYGLLARFDPPAYAPDPQGPVPRRFQTAIQSYSKADYARAIPELRAAAAAQPELVAARFYLGISLQLSGDSASGIQELRAVILAGETPYLDRARFYLAKALLGRRDIQGAQSELQNIIARHGDLEPQARALLAQIQ
jgi:TolA-binding protein